MFTSSCLGKSAPVTRNAEQNKSQVADSNHDFPIIKSGRDRCSVAVSEAKVAIYCETQERDILSDGVPPIASNELATIRATAYEVSSENRLPSEKGASKVDNRNVTPAHILLVDDDPGITEHLSRILEKEGFVVTVATDGEQALELIRPAKFDLVLLDIHLPKLDGRLVLRHMRDDGNQTPVILLTERYTSDADEVMGLEIGADDYIRKPFTGEVLVARIRNLLRRTRAGKLPLARFPKLNAGPDRPLVLHCRAKDAFLQGRALDLKLKEFELLECLMLHPDEVTSRERILDSLPNWIDDPRIIDRYMAPLRKALGDDPKSPTYIETVRSEGYRFIGPVEGEE